MPEVDCYVIRRSFLVPLGLAVLLLIVLLVVSILHGQPLAKLAFLVVFALPLTVLFAASAFRRLQIDASGVTAIRLLGQRRIDYSRITSLEAVRVRNRVFLTLAAGDDEFLIVSNAYARFPELVRALVQVLPETVVTDEARQLADAPPGRHADIVMIWFVIMALVYVLLAQFAS